MADTINEVSQEVNQSISTAVGFRREYSLLASTRLDEVIKPLILVSIDDSKIEESKRFYNEVFDLAQTNLPGFVKRVVEDDQYHNYTHISNSIARGILSNANENDRIKILEFIKTLDTKIQQDFPDEYELSQEMLKKKLSPTLPGLDVPSERP